MRTFESQLIRKHGADNLEARLLAAIAVGDHAEVIRLAAALALRGTAEQL